MSYHWNSTDRRIIDQNLDHSNFSGLCLIGVVFERCSLRGISFRGSDLSYARFIECDLYQTDFYGACLYAARINECDLTKSSFDSALLSGVRIKDVDITHTIFDEKIKLGCARKSSGFSRGAPGDNLLSVSVGDFIGPIDLVESQFDGLVVDNGRYIIHFTHDARSDKWRLARRREEVAKILKILLLDNGYSDRGLRFYHLERSWRRKAIPSNIGNRAKWLFDFVFGELLWAYGTSALRPLIFYICMTLVASVFFILCGLYIPGSGLTDRENPGEFISELNPGNIWFIFRYLVTVAFGADQFVAVGFASVLFIVYNLSSLILLSLLFASASRRLANL